MLEIAEKLLASRRGFMIGAGALLFADPAVAYSKLPVLWGDGVHDDTDALNALFNGKRVRSGEAGDTFRPLFHDGWVALKGGHYAISGTIKHSVPFMLLDATVTQREVNTPVFSGVFAGSPERPCMIVRNTFNMRAAKDPHEDPRYCPWAALGWAKGGFTYHGAT